MYTKSASVTKTYRGVNTKSASFFNNNYNPFSFTPQYVRLTACVFYSVSNADAM